MRHPRICTIPGVVRLVRTSGAAAALAGAFVLAAMAQGPPAVPVVVATAAERVLAPVTYFAGTVISRDDARIAAEVAGRLTWVAEVGTAVKRGQLVTRLEATLIRDTLAEREATVLREQARVTFYTQEVKRLAPLVNRKIVTPSNLDQAISNRDVAKGEVAVARARVKLAKEQLARTQIYAPFSGVVTERLKRVGEWAEPGEAVVRLVDSHSLEVQTRVPAETLAFIKAGTVLKLTASPKNGEGHVRTIVPVGDDRSRLYELRLSLEDSAWPAGQTLRVAVPTATPRKVIAVPRDALVLRRNGVSVYRILDDDTAERVGVIPGIAEGAFIEVRNGIHAGDRVVIRGGERLRPGMKVKVLPTAIKP